MALRTTIAVSVWMGCVVASMGALQKYANTPGQAAASPHFLTLELVEPILGRIDRSRIFLFLHERCPCTRASLKELVQNQRHLNDTAIEIVFSGPATNTDDRQLLRKLVRDCFPVAQIHDDPTGELARAYGAYTSGFAVMYRDDGTLHYAGGLTPSRAHAGPCPGRTALQTLNENTTTQTTEAPVFGCPLFSNSCDDAEYCGSPTP